MIMKQSALLTFLHYALVCMIFFLLHQFKFLALSPLHANLDLCDAYWYNDMRTGGYEFIANKMCNMAYFPLFPVFWSISNLNSLGITILNLMIFCISYSFLMRKFKYHWSYLILICSMPSFIFFALPYSESLFFLFGVILITGYQKNNNYLIFLGLLGCGLTRSVSTFFIPAIILTEYINYRSNRINVQLSVFIKRSVLYSSACLISISAVSCMQFLQTGHWFYFLKIQKLWGRHFEMPQLPFTTASPERVLGVDSIALVIGICAMFFLFRWIIAAFLPHFKSSTSMLTMRLPREVVFSMLYLAAIAFLDSFFTDAVDQRTKIWSMNRHIFCTPFVVCFLIWLFQHRPDSIDRKAMIIILIGGILLTSLFQYPYHLFYYVLFFIVFLPSFLLPRKVGIPFSKLILGTFYITNIVIFLKFYHSFLNDLWVG